MKIEEQPLDSHTGSQLLHQDKTAQGFSLNQRGAGTGALKPHFHSQNTGISSRTLMISVNSKLKFCGHIPPVIFKEFLQRSGRYSSAKKIVKREELGPELAPRSVILLSCTFLREGYLPNEQHSHWILETSCPQPQHKHMDLTATLFWEGGWPPLAFTGGFALVGFCSVSLQ